MIHKGIEVFLLSLLIEFQRFKYYIHTDGIAKFETISKGLFGTVDPHRNPIKHINFNTRIKHSEEKRKTVTGGKSIRGCSAPFSSAKETA
ncbi:hypothetical protein OO006_09615 [Prosthecochloris sp. SCSIO W1101]|uniref:hypothetical protein n=1 Tax=Prosthecochloris sp. SCSIO W1101 TaxID=2992242 RepID=UPI00223DA04F|nr:hypothetical protein [Prosthecochloris sp. SCSIO W1101]UZJ40611.1 hypothetical protein OO006_09615 [Prosthecochloris sp. SCSIO W1101]